ncbi:hypothetical protein GJ496_002333 [Pomphorhynchus laevis]|nr:hypothetical protein GJ496_002333 [Pomphorhynchus laevis]
MCCGTGVIGILIASHCSKSVVGIDLCEAAIDDAKMNCLRNNVIADFRTGKVEDLLGDLLNSVPAGSSIQVILDPPRCGVHRKLIRLIRACLPISSVIFIACALKMSMHNLIDLTKPDSIRAGGPAFKLVTCKAYDMFPQAIQSEVCMEFIR